MKVKSKLAIATGGCLLALLVIFYVSARAVISNSLGGMQLRVLNAVPEIDELFSAELNDLRHISATAARHPDTAAAVTEPPPESDNVEPTARCALVMADNGVNLFSVIDMEGRLRAGIMRSPLTDAPVALPSSFRRYFSPHGALLNSFRTNSVSPYTGIIAVSSGETNVAFLAGIAPIPNPEAKSSDEPPLGLLVFGRDIMSPRFQRNFPNGLAISARTIPVSELSSDTPRRPGIFSPLGEVSSENITIPASADNMKQVDFELPVQDIYGEHDVILNVSINSELRGVADMTKSRLLLVFAAIGVLCFIPVFVMQFGIVNGRISKLVKLVDSVEPKPNGQCLNWTRNDELSPVVDKINTLLLALDDEHAQSALSESLAKAFLSASPNTVAIIDNSGKIVKSIVRLGGSAYSSFADKFAAGKNIFELQGSRIESFRQAIANIDATSTPNGCHVSEFSLSDNEGGLVWVEARIVRVDAERILVLCQDITIRRTSGLERARLEDKINQIQKTESFGLLAGGLAHDYNNMLTAMLGNVDLILCDNTIAPGVRETVGDVRSAMLRASSLVRRMLAYACKSAPVVEQTDINAMVKDLVRLMRRSIPDNVRLIVAAGDAVPVIQVDSTQLWQVVMNLVINACDALNERQGTVRLSTLGMQMSGQELEAFNSADPLKDGWYSVIEVEDTGVGMDDRTVRRIFDPFFTTKANGRGLGLSSVISIVKSYGGGIGVRSRLGQGTTFRIVFPSDLNEAGTPVYPEDLAKKSTASIVSSMVFEKDKADGPSPDQGETPQKPAVEKTPEVPSAESPAASAEAADGKKTLLVVDDDVSILKLLKIILKSAGYNIVTATNGMEGLKVYQKSPKLFSLALVDASMGAGMNGMELCGEIRKQNATLPLILMSAYRAKEMSSKMATAGISGFLAKPFRGNDVVDLVAKYLKSAEFDSANKGGTDGVIL